MSTSSPRPSEVSSGEISVLSKKTVGYLKSSKKATWYVAVRAFLQGYPYCPSKKKGSKRETYTPDEYSALVDRLNIILFQPGAAGREIVLRYVDFLAEAERIISSANTPRKGHLVRDKSGKLTVTLA